MILHGCPCRISFRFFFRFFVFSEPFGFLFGFFSHPIPRGALSLPHWHSLLSSAGFWRFISLSRLYCTSRNRKMYVFFVNKLKIQHSIRQSANDSTKSGERFSAPREAPGTDPGRIPFFGRKLFSLCPFALPLSLSCPTADQPSFGRDAAATDWPTRLLDSSGMCSRTVFASVGNSLSSTSCARASRISPPLPEVTRPMMRTCFI